MKYEESLYGGRPASLVLADERTLMRLIPRFYQCMLLLAALFMCCLAGCAEAPRIYVQDGVTFHSNNVSPCQKGARACYAFGQVWYLAGFEDDRDHEILHAHGLLHGAWDISVAATDPYTNLATYNICTRITSGFRNQWRIGNLICRRNDGVLYEKAL